MKPRRAILLLHRWAGLTLGLLTMVICITGSVAVFRPEFDRLAAAPASNAPRAADLDAVAARLVAQDPGVRAAGLVLAQAPGEPDAWILRGERGGMGWTAFTDPATGEDLGRTRDRRASIAVAWIARFHHDLWLPPVGGVVVGIGGLAMLGFCVSGVWLCWPGLFRRRLDAHRLTGLAVLPVLLLVALTGAMFEFVWLRRAAHGVLGGTVADAPPGLREPAQRPQSAPGGDPDLAWMAVLAAAAGAVPDGRIARLSPPRRNDASATWRAVIEVPGNGGPNGGAIVQLDRRSGAILEIQDVRSMSAGGWLLNQQLGLHTGAWGGMTARLLWAVAGIAPVVLFITGWRMWRRRQRKQPFARLVDHD